jgi:hypothetical protein
MTTGASPDEDPAMIERLDAGEPASSPEEAEARAPYERLLARIRDLDDIAPPGDWEDRAVTRWSGGRRKWRLGIALGAAASAAAALAAVLLLRPCTAPTATELEVAVLDSSGSTRRGDAAVGELLRARARADRAHVELRVYLGTRLVARCPGSTACRRDGSIMELDWKLVEAGTYQVILLSSSSDIPAGDGTLDRDLLDARSAGTRIEPRSLTVTP